MDPGGVENWSRTLSRRAGEQRAAVRAALEAEVLSLASSGESPTAPRGGSNKTEGKNLQSKGKGTQGDTQRRARAHSEPGGVVGVSAAGDDGAGAGDVSTATSGTGDGPLAVPKRAAAVLYGTADLRRGVERLAKGGQLDAIVREAQEATEEEWARIGAQRVDAEARRLLVTVGSCAARADAFLTRKAQQQKQSGTAELPDTAPSSSSSWSIGGEAYGLDLVLEDVSTVIPAALESFEGLCFPPATQTSRSQSSSGNSGSGMIGEGAAAAPEKVQQQQQQQQQEQEQQEQQNDHAPGSLPSLATLVARRRTASETAVLRSVADQLGGYSSQLQVRLEDYLDVQWKRCFAIEEASHAAEHLQQRQQQQQQRSQQRGHTAAAASGAGLPVAERSWEVRLEGPGEEETGSSSATGRSVVALASALERLDQFSRKLGRVTRALDEMLECVLVSGTGTEARVATNQAGMRVESTARPAPSLSVAAEEGGGITDAAIIEERCHAVQRILRFVADRVLGAGTASMRQWGRASFRPVLLTGMQRLLSRTLPATATELEAWKDRVGAALKELNAVCASTGFACSIEYDGDFPPQLDGVLSAVLAEFDERRHVMLLERARRLIARWDLAAVHKSSRAARKAVDAKTKDCVLARARLPAEEMEMTVSKSCSGFAVFLIREVLAADAAGEDAHEHVQIRGILDVIQCVLVAYVVRKFSDNVFIHVQLHNDMMFLSALLRDWSDPDACPACTKQCLSGAWVLRELGEEQMETAVESTWDVVNESLQACGEFDGCVGVKGAGAAADTGSSTHTPPAPHAQDLSRVRHTLEQVFKQIKGLLPKHVALAFVGMLLGRVLRRLVAVVLSRTDIGAAESHALFELYSPFLVLEHTLLSGAAPQSVDSFIDVDAVPSWKRFVRVCDLLELKLVQILQFLDDGFYDQILTQSELQRLVCALFSDSPKRQSVLDLIAKREGLAA